MERITIIEILSVLLIFYIRILLHNGLEGLLLVNNNEEFQNVKYTDVI